MWRELLGLERKSAGLLDLIIPRRSFQDVVLPDATRQQLFEALIQIEKHRLIFTSWGLGERHPNGTGLVFNFAGPPGTGKTICAEAVAYTLGRKLLRVDYSELESCWVGETSKNLRQVFREARTADAVLFFDEADSVAGRRFSSITAGNEREANQAVNVLLKEVEEHEGVVIFATNMASNFDPAFERRIRTHILFHPPGVLERERIWQVQVHPDKTPLADDVDFQALAQQFELTGGDIRNAVLKAAQMAAAEAGPDEGKQIRQSHFLAAIAQVRAARNVMQQNSVEEAATAAWQQAAEAASQRVGQLDADLHACRTELGILADGQTELGLRLDETAQRLDTRVEALSATTHTARDDFAALRGSLEGMLTELRGNVAAQQSALERFHGEQGDHLKQLTERVAAQEQRLQRATLLPWPKPTTAAAAVAAALAMLALGGVAGHFLKF
ncbi:MAG: ATP-binding protein [Actinomycetota bacterium]